MALLEGAVLPQGSWIVVTGANGFVASHVVDQFLVRGYNVRGTVRDAKKSAWLTGYFSKKYPDAKFELVELKDLTDVEALKKVAEGCAGFAAVASDVSFSTDVEQVITPAINLSIAALEAATATPTIKRFVQTASSAAASADVPWGTEHDLPADSYNTRAVEIAYAGDKSDPALGVWVYSASKVKQEQAVWAFREAARTKAGGAGALPFEISTVLPDFVVGEVLSPADQGYPTSVGVLRQVWDGDMAMASVMPPQYEVDARDTALLHVAALLHPGVAGERLFAYGERKNWANTLALWRELYPGRTFPDPPEGEQEYKANVLARPRAEEVLKWVKGSGFTDYKTSLKELGEQFLGESR